MEKNDGGWKRVEKKRGWKDKEREDGMRTKDKKQASGLYHHITHLQSSSPRFKEDRKSFAEAAKNGWTDKGNEQGGKEEKGLKEHDVESRIKPRFKEEQNQLIVRPTFYNGRRFAGFVSHLEAKHKLYNEAMGLNCKDLHGIGFIRDSEDNLLIVFKLNCKIETFSLKKRTNTQELTEQEKKTGLNVKLSTGLMDGRRRAWMKL